MYQNWIITIFKKKVVKQIIKKIEENFEIVAIPNKYKNPFNDLINSSDIESPNKFKLINKGSCNMSRFESNLIKLLERDYFDKDVLDKSS